MHHFGRPGSRAQRGRSAAARAWTDRVPRSAAWNRPASLKFVTKLLQRGAEVATVPRVRNESAVENRHDAGEPTPTVSQGRGGVSQGDDSGSAAGDASRVVPTPAQAQRDGKAPVRSQAKNEPTPAGPGAWQGGNEESWIESSCAAGGGRTGGARRGAERGEEHLAGDADQCPARDRPVSVHDSGGATGHYDVAGCTGQLVDLPPISPEFF